MVSFGTCALLFIYGICQYINHNIRLGLPCLLPTHNHNSNTCKSDSLNKDDSSSITSHETQERLPSNNPTIIENLYRTQATPLDHLHPQSTLHMWLTTKPRQENHTHMAVPPAVMVTPTNPTRQHYHQPQLITPTTNKHWGDQMLQPKPSNFFHVLSKNVNSMMNSTNYVHWKAAAQAIKNSEADAIFFQETNIVWDKIHQKRVQTILSKTTGHAIISTASSTEISTKTITNGVALSRQSLETGYPEQWTVEGISQA